MLSKKVVVITGGAGLLGTEFSKSIAENNGIAIIADIDEQIAKESAEKLSTKLNKTVDYIFLDITSKKSIDSAITSIIKKHKKIDALVNNAYPRNKNYGKDFFDVSYDDFIENINLNIGGYFLCSQIFAKYFKAHGSGNIINIASIYGVVAPKFNIYKESDMNMPVEYAVIKSSLIHLTKYLAKYLSNYNVRVNSISPGGIIDKQPQVFIDAYREECLQKGMLNVEDISGTLIFLLSELSEYVNGQNLIVDDGFTL